MSGTAQAEAPTSIKLVSHSMLFYWWPVWAFGFVLGALSLVDGYRLAILPEGTGLRTGGDTAPSGLFELLVPDGKADSLRELVKRGDSHPFQIPVAASKNYGILFCFVLLLVIFSTNIPLRGLWSAIVLLLLLLTAFVLAGLDLWGKIFDAVGHLHIYITAAGYLFLSSALFVLWVVTVFLFDPKRYIIFTPGQLIVHQEVGDLRQVFDTTNVVVEKERSDFFRHVLLGFFSGDILVRVQGGQAQVFRVPNVLFAAWKVEQVANLMKTRPVISEA